MTQKLINVGNSIAITINRQVLKQMDLSSGDKVKTEFFPETNKFVVSPQKSQTSAIPDKQVLTKLKQLKKRHGKLYHKLAQQSEKTVS